MTATSSATEGDSFFVLFRRAIDGVSAAVDGQRAIAAEPWPEAAAVRVRMGLHTGEVAVDRRRRHRLRHQSDGAHRRVGARRPGPPQRRDAGARRRMPCRTGVGLRDLGLHRLKDLREPERLTQLVVEGLPDDFPALRSLDARPNNLPTQLDDVRRARTRARRGGRASASDAAADPDRSGRHGQDPAVAAGGSLSGG